MDQVKISKPDPKYDYYKVNNAIEIEKPIRQLPENEILFYLRDYDLTYRIFLINKKNEFVLGKLSLLEEMLKRMGQRNVIYRIAEVARQAKVKNELLYKRRDSIYKKILKKIINLFR